MQQNYSQRLEMQIPQENAYIGINNTRNIDIELEEFLKKHYKFPSNNLKDIENFIGEDDELEKIIYGLPKIISKEFPQSPILLDFTQYSLPNENVLEIVIKSQYDGETTSSKKDHILDEIFTKYSKTTNEYYLSMEF
jgi:hypothetical protein